MAEENPNASIQGETPTSPWVGLIILLPVFIWLTVASWQRWPDLVVDYGRELYVPWQLTEGQTLYQDMAYFNGPLAPYINATLFRVFGVSIMTLVYANLLLIGLVTALLYSLLSKICSLNVTTACCVTFLIVFAFSQQLMYGNYNFVCPYSHEATYGFFFALLAIFLFQLKKIPVSARAILCGMAVGCTFLCKPEFFIATTAAIGGMWFVSWRCSRSEESEDAASNRYTLVSLALILAGSFIPVCVAVLLLSQSIGIELAIDGTIASWKGILGSDVTQHLFYQTLRGTGKPVENMLNSIWSLLGVVTAVYGAYLFQRIFEGKAKLRWLMLVVLVFIIAHCLLGEILPFLLSPKMLTFLMVLFSTWLFIELLKKKRTSLSVEELVMFTGLAMLGLFLLTKLFLNPRISHYGFVLAVPSTLLIIVIIFELIPRVVFGGQKQLPVFRLILGTFLVFDLALYYNISQQYFSQRTLVVTRQNETILGFNENEFLERDLQVKALLEEQPDLIGEDQTLACLPEGVTINYLLRKRNPTPYFNLMPIELQLFGTETITNSYKSNPPDFIALVHKNSPEYGPSKFGDPQFGGELMDWVKENYDEVKQYGAKPFTSEHFGITLLKLHRSR